MEHERAHWVQARTKEPSACRHPSAAVRDGSAGHVVSVSFFETSTRRRVFRDQHRQAYIDPHARRLVEQIRAPLGLEALDLPGPTGNDARTTPLRSKLIVEAAITSNQLEHPSIGEERANARPSRLDDQQ
jgi:hypothetical protein